ncbi:unnamed protein product, partial [Allacma fusca]
MAFTVLK